MRQLFLILTLALLGACTTSPGASSKAPSASIPRVSLPVRPGSAPARPPSRPPEAPAPTAAAQPRMMQEAGLEGIIGKPAEALTAQFGKARLDGTEGDVRKLQFRGQTCVLDIYLYPSGQSRTQVAAHVEARNPSNGSAIDRARCAADIARSAQG